MMSLNAHALQREVDRLGYEMSQEDIELHAIRASRIAQSCDETESIALHLASLHFVGEAWSDQSNGTMLVAIIREKEVKTFMFRRDTQPFEEENLRVDRCVSIAS
jgi:hypothetical protein